MNNLITSRRLFSATVSSQMSINACNHRPALCAIFSNAKSSFDNDLTRGQQVDVPRPSARTLCTVRSSSSYIKNRHKLLSSKQLIGGEWRCKQNAFVTENIVRNICTPVQGSGDIGPSQTLNWNKSTPLPPHVDAKVSYAFGRSMKQLEHFTLAPLVNAMIKREPHSTAVIFYDEGVCKNFEELGADVNKLINGLVNNLGLVKGDRVGVYSYNSYQFVLLQIACNMLGLILNPFNPSYKVHELSYVLGKSEINALFMHGRNSKHAYLNDHYAVLTDKSIKQMQIAGKLRSLKHIVALDGDLGPKDCFPLNNVNLFNWRHVFTDQSEMCEAARKITNLVETDDLYGIYYTSGTTGFPKGASITQFNVINNTNLAVQRLFAQRGPRFKPLRPNVCLGPLPLFHEFAGVLGMVMPFLDGGSIVFTGARYNIQSVLDSIMRFKCNAIFLTPTILIDLLGLIESHNIENIPLKLILVAGSKVIPELVHRTHKVLPDLEELRIGYGSSENGVIATIQTSQECEDTKALTVGPPLDFTEVRIADVDTEETKLLGECGEVQTRGFNTMVGYFKDDDKTNAVITESRWYKTGDLGMLDKNGSLQIVGRIKELIIKGGENIYPAEVEMVLHANELIEDAHVFGVPDKRYGEEVCVWIKLKKSAKSDDMLKDQEALRKSIIDYCKSRLTYFRVPKYVMFVEEFPLTPVKKVKKFEMRAKMTEMLNLKG